MNVEIERLNLRLSDENISPDRAQALGKLVGETLHELLRGYAAELSAAPAGYRVPFVSLPALRVRAGASADEIAQQVAEALARSILRDLEIL